MSRKPWWEWDAAELKHRTKVPAGYSIDYYEKPHGNDVWRKYLIDREPCNLSVSDISQAIDDGKSSGMAYAAGRIWLQGACLLVGKHRLDWDNPQAVEAELKERKLLHTDVWGAKADLGTAVHDALEHLCAGTVPSLGNYDAEVRPYIKAICAWFADNDPHVLHTEMLVGSREWKYAGRFDLLYEQNGKRVLADLKTSAKVRPGALIQLAGYSLALEECGYPPVDRKEVIWAKPDGHHKVIESSATHQDFINHIRAYTSFNTHKNLLEKAA